jgi:glycosyltransferase involved in cell wall biosynthesis
MSIAQSAAQCSFILNNTGFCGRPIANERVQLRRGMYRGPIKKAGVSRRCPSRLRTDRNFSHVMSTRLRTEELLQSDAVCRGTQHRTYPVRALFINDTSRNGGPGRTILDILKFLDRSSIHRTVLVPREGIVSRSLLDAKVVENLILAPNFVENIFEPFSRPIERRDFDAPFALKLVRALGNVVRAAIGIVKLVGRVRRERFDVVFCNGTAANLVGGAIAAVTRMPVIWHVFYPSVAPAIRPVHSRLSRLANVRSIICVSNTTARQFAHCRSKIHVVHDALDTEEFAPVVTPALRKELGIDGRSVIFGSHGRVLRRKGFIELIQAARLVFDRLIGEEQSRCRFVVLGDTPQDMRLDHLEECRELVRKLDLAQHVQFVGFRADVRSWLSDFDVAVVPSVYEDPLPRAVLESMAMSKPVIAFDVGGIGEMIDDRVEGRLVRGTPPDIEGIAAACLDYFSNAEMRLQHGRAARLRVERDFDARTHARILQDELIRAAER